jgi:hypothetical protein
MLNALDDDGLHVLQLPPLFAASLSRCVHAGL